MTSAPLLIGGLGTPELLIIFAVIVLIFGAAKLPDLARSSGQALRIFKAETKELRSEDNEKTRAEGDSRDAGNAASADRESGSSSGTTS